VTINIGLSPAVLLVAGVWAILAIVPDGPDELSMAGGLQGYPVELVKARTVDAWALAESEWVLEGHILPDRVWESDEAERIGKERVAPFFPEWNGYLGKALLVPKFQVTAITHRRDRPIFYTPLAGSFEADNMGKVIREACFFELAQRIVPGLVVDCNIPYGNRVNTGVVYKVKKRGRGDDSLLRNLLIGALGASLARLVIAVDDDINIYNQDDIWWAVSTRLNTRTGIVRAPAGAAATGYVLADWAARAGETEGGEGIAVDATSPFDGRASFRRAHYPSDSVDLSRHFSGEQLAKIRAQQSEWARYLAEIGG
jgi:4-hydroxy-3-polyprenylbenzoate decarboxylase